MQEKMKEIISVFIKIPAGEIGPATAIDRTALGSSIMLHRMYARLAKEGVSVDDYANIKNFADLLRQSGDPSKGQHEAFTPVSATPAEAGPAYSADGGIGIDMEEISSLPRTHDFRKEEFYTMNFSPSEIAYCVLQTDAYASFAGLFAAKEAIVKAGNRYRGRVFHTIEIGHSSEGKPLHPEFYLSITHTGPMAVAVAIPSGATPSLTQPALPDARTSVSGKGGAWVYGLVLISLALSAIALFFAFRR
jgi:phosphopantetheine--protein transferase-like protein